MEYGVVQSKALLLTVERYAGDRFPARDSKILSVLCRILGKKFEGAFIRRSHTMALEYCNVRVLPSTVGEF